MDKDKKSHSEDKPLVETKDFHEESPSEKRVRLQKELAGEQIRAKAGREESDIGLADPYWNIKRELQTRLERLNETPDDKL